MSPGLDAIVVGGGFYGCSVALALKERMSRVALFEQDSGLLLRASYNNQARVHAGYHYPRSLLTAIRSAENYPRFTRQFADCIDGRCTHLYAIARRMSKVSAYQFQRFCDQVKIALRPAPRRVEQWFNHDLIESVFCVDESVFDAAKLRARMTANLAAARVEVNCGRQIERFTMQPDGVTVHVADSTCVHARYAFNCTYSGINHILSVSGLRPLSLKQEIAELALIEVPEPLRGFAITVMDGPFFSMVPFPPRGCHTLSHVTYTPHASWSNGEERRESAAASKSIFMLRDAQRYIPILQRAESRSSLFEIKTILLRNEADDGRPILCYRHPELPALFSILGSKIDNIYDIVRTLETELFSPEVVYESNG